MEPLLKSECQQSPSKKEKPRVLETNVGEIIALAENSEPIISDPPNIKLVTGPLPNSSDPNFFDL